MASDCNRSKMAGHLLLLIVPTSESKTGAFDGAWLGVFLAFGAWKREDRYAVRLPFVE